MIKIKKQEQYRPPCPSKIIKSNGQILDNFGFNISKIPSETELKTLNLSKKSVNDL